MKAAPFVLHQPQTPAEVVGLLQEHGPEAKVLAGGQSLVPMLALRLTRYGHLVDVNRVDGLQDVRLEPGRVGIGAGVRQAVVERSGELRDRVPLLARAVPHIGHFQIRNRGTVGGSLAHADPAAELPATAMALDAEFEILGPAGTRWVRADDFFVGTWTTCMADDELLLRAWFPVATGATGYAFEEVARRAGDFALAGAAAVVQLDGDRRVCGAAAALLGMGSIPVRATVSSLVGSAATAADVDEAVATALADQHPPDDVHASSAYRRHLGTHLLRVALHRAVEEAHRG